LNSPRFQIFVSSTFRDLQAERQAALLGILELNHIPAGMEIFPASDDTPWDLIKSVILESDYYVLIIGGRYGSTTKAGIGYTELEYDCAVEANVPVLPFLHENPLLIPSGKSELEPEARARLSAFRQRVQDAHHCKFWNSADQLKAQIVVGITTLARSKQRPGWVRGDSIASLESLQRLADLQQRYDRLSQEHEELKAALKDRETATFAQGSDSVELRFTIGEHRGQAVRVTWDDVFLGLAPDLTVPLTARTLLGPFSRLLYAAFRGTEDHERIAESDSELKTPPSEPFCQVSQESMEMVMVQLGALDLVEIVPYTETQELYHRTMQSVYRSWTLTERGRRIYLQRAAIRKEPS